MPLETLVKNWYEARRNMLNALSETDSYMNEKGKGKEIGDVSSLSEAWKSLSNAEWALFNHVRDKDV